jgi:hypothetical protein
LAVEFNFGGFDCGLAFRAGFFVGLLELFLQLAYLGFQFLYLCSIANFLPLFSLLNPLLSCFLDLFNFFLATFIGLSELFSQAIVFLLGSFKLHLEDLGISLIEFSLQANVLHF